MSRHTETRPESFELVIGGAIILLGFFLERIFDILFAEWITLELKDKFGLTAAEVIERSGAILVLGSLAIVIVWFLYRYLKAYFDRRIDELTNPMSVFDVSNYIYSESRTVQWKNGNSSELYETSYYLNVGNRLDTGKTLRRVQARIFHIGEPVLVRVKETSGGEVDIRHGEWALFEIGKIVSKELDGPYQGIVVLDDEWRHTYEHNVNIGSLNFGVYSFTGKREYGFAQSPAHIWSISMVLSADEVLAIQVRIDIDMGKTKDRVFMDRLAYITGGG
jgi:hypothetical protein